MGWDYYGFKPYVPVAQRRREAERELGKLRKKGLVVQPINIDGRTIAKTFWGKHGARTSSRTATTRTACRAGVPMYATDQLFTLRLNRAKSRPKSAGPIFIKSRSRSHPCPTCIGKASRVGVRAR